MARPRKEAPDARSHVVGVRLTLDERIQLDSKADSACLSLSDLMRQAALGARIEVAGEVGPPLPARAQTPDGIEHVVALNRVGVNLNQIARNLNAGLGLVPAELDACLARVNELLDDWQGVAP